MRSLGGEEWADWLRRHGLVGLEGIDSRSLVLRLRDSGAMRAAAVSDETRAPRRRGARAGSRAALDGRTGARRAGVDARGIRLRGERLTARRRRRLRREALDLPPPREGGSGRDGRPAHRVGRRARAVRRRPPLERARGPGAPARGGRHRARAPRPRSRSSGSASAISSSASRPGTRRTSSPSATAAPTIRFSSAGPAAFSSRARTTASRSRPPRARRRRTSRSTTARSRASTSPSCSARSVQFHPEAGPGPHDAWPILEDWVEELRR